MKTDTKWRGDDRGSSGRSDGAFGLAALPYIVSQNETGSESGACFSEIETCDDRGSIAEL